MRSVLTFIRNLFYSLPLILMYGLQRLMIFRRYPDTQLNELPELLSRPQSKPTTVEHWEYLMHRVLLHDPLPYVPIHLSGLKRARKHPDGDDRDFVEVSELWYPPAKSISKLGRLNEAGQPRLYAAQDGVTALLEMRPRAGDVFSLLVIKTRETVYLPVTLLGLARSRNGATIKNGGSVEDYYDEIRKVLTKRQYERFTVVENWLTDLVTKTVKPGEEEEYLPTVGLANMLLNRIPGYPDGRSKAVIYPSVAAQFLGDNVCMSAEVGDSLYVPHAAWKVRFVGLAANHSPADPHIIVEPIKRSKLIGEDGKIEWYEPGYGFGPESLRMIFGQLDHVDLRLPGSASQNGADGGNRTHTG